MLPGPWVSWAKEAVPDLLPLLKQDAARVRDAAALGRIDPPAKEAVPSLVPLLKDGDRNVRMASAFAIGETGETVEAVSALLPSLRDPVSGVRWHPAQALGRIVSRRGTSRLVRCGPSKPLPASVTSAEVCRTCVGPKRVM